MSVCVCMWQLELKMCYCDKIKAELRSPSSKASLLWLKYTDLQGETHVDKPEYGPPRWRQAKGLENNMKTEI